MRCAVSGGLLLWLCLPLLHSSVSAADEIVVWLDITSSLSFPNTPVEPVLDFSALITSAGQTGTVDPDSLQLRNRLTGKSVECSIRGDLLQSAKGRIGFVAGTPGDRQYELRFRTSAGPITRTPTGRVPLLGTGDLLRFNAGVPRPVAVPYSAALRDVTGSGKSDLIGTWNYGYRAGEVWDSIVVHRQAGAEDRQVTDQMRIRVVTDAHPDAHVISHTYMGCDFADLNGDSRLDLVVTRRNSGSAGFFLNSGRQDAHGLPVYRAAGEVAVSGWHTCQLTDLDGNGVIDLIVDGELVRNRHAAGWPFQPETAVTLDAGRNPVFLDINGDGWQDALCLQGADSLQPDFYRIAWRAHLGTCPPSFGPEQLIEEVDLPWTSHVSTWEQGESRGILVQHQALQSLTRFELTGHRHSSAAGDRFRFRSTGRMESMEAVLALSDQAWPCLCDWDDDGDPDLLVGGGFGWPRIVINDGTQTEPAFREPQFILSQGRPIRLTRNQILGEPHNSHDMGYLYPVFVDWDGDGLRDLMCPNETNRLLWFRNTGRRGDPRFGPVEQILCEGYPDSRQLRSLSNQRANDPESNNGVYPREEERPFFWRVGVAFADFNGDGMMDFVTHDGATVTATLFEQFLDPEGNRRVRKGPILKLQDGRPITDQIVARRSHWTESFRAVDWDQDGLQDLLYSVAGAHNGTQDDGSIYLLQNVGTPQRPVFAAPRTMCCYGEPIRVSNHGPHPWPGDVNGDGLPDIVACTEWSVYPYFSYSALMMDSPPEISIRLAPVSR